MDDQDKTKESITQEDDEAGAAPVTEEREGPQEEPSKPQPTPEAEEKPAEAAEAELKGKEIIAEQVYTIPLRRAWIRPFPERTPYAVKLVRKFINRHMKPKGVRIHQTLNQVLWQRGIEKPPRRVRVKAAKDKDEIVYVYPLKTSNE